MKGNWIWIIVALAVFAVNVWLGIGQQSGQPDGMMWMIHYGLAVAALVFAIVLVISGFVQTKASKRLKALGLTDGEIRRLATDKSAEPEILARLSRRSQAVGQSPATDQENSESPRKEPLK